MAVAHTRKHVSRRRFEHTLLGANRLPETIEGGRFREGNDRSSWPVRPPVAYVGWQPHAGPASPRAGDEIFYPGDAVAAVPDDAADRVIASQAREGFGVRARMSTSAMIRHYDDIAILTFDNPTEQLWTTS